MIRVNCSLFLMHEHDERFVDSAKINFIIMEVIKKLHDIIFDHGPASFEKGRPKPVWVGARIVVHGEKGRFDFSWEKGKVRLAAR